MDFFSHENLLIKKTNTLPAAVLIQTEVKHVKKPEVIALLQQSQQAFGSITLPILNAKTHHIGLHNIRRFEFLPRLVQTLSMREYGVRS